MHCTYVTLSLTLIGSTEAYRETFYRKLSALGLTKEEDVDTTWTCESSRTPEEWVQLVSHAAETSYVGVNFLICNGTKPLRGNIPRRLSPTELLTLAFAGIPTLNRLHLPGADLLSARTRTLLNAGDRGLLSRIAANSSLFHRLGNGPRM